MFKQPKPASFLLCELLVTLMRKSVRLFLPSKNALSSFIGGLTKPMQFGREVMWILKIDYNVHKNR